MAGARAATGRAGGPTGHGRGRRIRGLDATERQAQRRRQLLDAALELFASKGYANTAIEQICQTAFVGTKAFYELFDGKESCYLALLDEVTLEMSERMVAALDAAPGDERAATRDLLAAFVGAVVDDPRRARATFGQAGGISPAVEAKRRANRRWAAEFVESVWARYGVDGDGLDLHHVAVGLVGGLFDLVIDWLDDADDEADTGPLVQRLGDFYDSVRRGVAATP
jgi:AcrR family transcriptional regulator